MQSVFHDKTFLLFPGLKYDLTVLKLLVIEYDQQYYVCADDNGLKHLIPEIHYRHYGIKPGDRIRCRLDRINCLGRFFFEPDHPLYEQLKTYEFTLKGFKKSGRDNLDNYTAIVEDIFGHEWETKPFRSSTALPYDLKSVFCCVKALKKARLYLELSDSRIR
jgi:hypothetical protein